MDDDEGVCERGVSGGCSDSGVVIVSSAGSSAPRDVAASVGVSGDAAAAAPTDSVGSGNVSSPSSCTTLSAALR